MEQFEVIRKQRRDEELSIRELARRHGVHRRTVREALASAVPPPRKTPDRVSPVLGVHEATIRRWLVEDLSAPRKQRHTARRVWRRLRDEEGADVAESTVRAFVALVRAELGDRGRPVTVVQEHAPGEEAEVDFGEFQALVGGVPSRLWLFVMRLSFSGRAFVVAFSHQAQEAFFEGHVLAFAHFGGVPAGRVRYDNLKAAVIRILVGRDRVENERFVALRSHYGFDSFFCEPGVGGAHEKGGVEGEVGRFRRTHLVPVPEAGSLGELNARIRAMVAADDARRVGRRVETVGEAFAVEATRLHPLPDEPFDAARQLSAKVDDKARICVLGAHYSVPVRLVRRRVTIRLAAARLEVLDPSGGAVVAVHDRSLHKHAQHLQLDHYLEVLGRRPGALAGSTALAQARAAGLFTATHDRFWTLARRDHGDSDGTRRLVEVLLLHRRMAAAAVLGGIDAALEVSSTDPALVAIEARRLADRPSATVVPIEAALGRYDRPAPTLHRYDHLLRPTDPDPATATADTADADGTVADAATVTTIGVRP